MGATRVVANCAVLTEGFDEPSVDCIIMARPTQSAVLYQQMLGRGTRTYPGKTDCLVLDVVGASTHHTLHTAATLFDCDARRLARQSILDLLERPAHSDQEDAARTGTLHMSLSRFLSGMMRLSHHPTVTGGTTHGWFVGKTLFGSTAALRRAIMPSQ